MPKDKLTHLGNCIRAARHACNLTQQELADQCHVAIKTVQNIEKGTMNPSFEILYPIINRLGISANTLFNPNYTNDEQEMQHLIGKFQACNSQEREFVLNILDYLLEQLSVFQQEHGRNQ